MKNRYNMKWAHIMMEHVGSDPCIFHYEVDFSGCRSIELTDLDRYSDEGYIREVYEKEISLDEDGIQQDGYEVPEEVVESFIDAITEVIDNGGIDKSDSPVDDHNFNTVVIYDDNNTEIYRAEWNSGDEIINEGPVYDAFFETFFELMDSMM